MHLPQAGRIVSFDAGGFGRIELVDGTELKFGVRLVRDLKLVTDETEPSDLVGLEVVVQAVEPHPLGGFRATAATRAEPVESFAEFGECLTADDWLAAWRTHGMEPDDLRRVRALLRPAGFVSGVAGRPGLGSSKLGGLPDVADSSWPEDEQHQPLNFLAQIALQQVPAPVLQSLRLPAAGLLQFFFDAERQPWNTPQGSFAVRLLDASTPLRTLQEDSASFFEPRAIRIVQLETPCADLQSIEAANLSANGRRLYRHALSAFASARRIAPNHQLGGFAHEVQDGLEREGRLLMQFDSDDWVSWGDVGKLYFTCAPDVPFEVSSVRCTLQST